MKIKIPEKEIEICDICQRENCLRPLTECLVCGQQYCITCAGIIPGCMVSANIGKCCSKRDDVLKIVDRYAEQMMPIVKKRNIALYRLRKK